MGIKRLCISDKIREYAWPNLNDAATRIYERSKNKESVDLKITPYLLSYGQKVITSGLTIATAYYLLK
jgi:hypothetical protein